MTGNANKNNFRLQESDFVGIKHLTNILNKESVRYAEDYLC